MTAHLWIGNRNYSSWSLRAWLCLTWAGIEFTESLIDLDQPGYGERLIADVLAVSPTGQVPALKLGTETVCDTLAIAEWAAESSAGPPLLAQERLTRAQMRSVIGEMHSGFTALRRELPMNIQRRCTAYGLSPQALADIRRIDSLWSALRSRYRVQGDYLFGKRSLADAFYLPVATRMRTYGFALSPAAAQYQDLVLGDPAFLKWEQQALAEPRKPFSRANIDTLYPTAARHAA